MSSVQYDKASREPASTAVARGDPMLEGIHGTMGCKLSWYIQSEGLL